METDSQKRHRRGENPDLFTDLSSRLGGGEEESPVPGPEAHLEPPRTSG